MKIETIQELILFIEQEQDKDNISKVFEQCLNTKILINWKDESIDIFKNRLIEFIYKYGNKDISERPLIVNPFH